MGYIFRLLSGHPQAIYINTNVYGEPFRLILAQCRLQAEASSLELSVILIAELSRPNG